MFLGLPTLNTAVVAGAAVLAQASDDNSVNPLLGWLPIIILGGVLWFLMIRPQRKRQQGVREFQSTLSVGDEVRTAGGIVGTVTSLNDREASVRSGDIELRIMRAAIVARAESDTE